MNILTLILSTILTIFFERLVGVLLDFNFATLHIMPILVMYYVINRGLWLAIICSVFGGWLIDSISGLPWGTSMISLILISIIIRAYGNLAFRHLWIEHLILGTLAGALFVFFSYLLLKHFAELTLQIPFLVVIGKAIISALFCGLTAPFFYKTMDFLENLLGNVNTMQEGLENADAADKSI